LAERQGGKKKFRFKNKLVSLDSSVIDLCLSLYDWAKFRRTKGAVKLHLLLDHDGYLPCFAVITEGNKSDIKVARTMKFERGTVLVMDRGYNDYDWFAELTDQGVFFVTRMKVNADYEVVGRRKPPEKSNVRRDEDIFFYSMAADGKPYFFRRIEVWDEAKQDTLVFLTNHMGFGATTIAAIYKDRWQVELFFKALKQSLKIKTFLGTSANAVHTQIWTALIAMLIVKYLQLKSSFGWSLSNLVALLRHQLFVYRDLDAWLNDPFQPPPAVDEIPDDPQLTMAWG
jgi:IS4 transposase